MSEKAVGEALEAKLTKTGGEAYSFQQRENMIREALRPAKESGGAKGPCLAESEEYVKETFLDKFILDKGGKLFEVPYAIKGGKAVLGQRTPVVTAYKKA